MAGKTVVVLGGGVGGLVASRRLRQWLGREHRVVMVDRRDKHYFAPAFPWVMVDWRKPEKTYRPLAALTKKGIEFRHSAIAKIDVEGRKVQTEAGELAWDYLVIALGTEMAYDTVPGLSDAHTFYTLEGAVKLRDALRDFGGGKVVLAITGMPYRCPAAPYEGALLMDHLFRKKGLRNRAEIKIFTPEPAPLPVAGPAVGNIVKELLQKRDVSFVPGKKLTRVDGDKKQVAFEDGTQESFELLVTVPQHRASSVVKESGLTGESGWVHVDKHTLATNAPNVYALGDVAFIKLPSGLPLPKAGVFAHGQAEVVARNIAASILEKEGGERFKGGGS